MLPLIERNVVSLHYFEDALKKIKVSINIDYLHLFQTKRKTFLDRLTSLNCGFSLIYCHLIPWLARAAPKSTGLVSLSPVTHVERLIFPPNSQPELIAYRPVWSLLDTFRVGRCSIHSARRNSLDKHRRIRIAVHADLPNIYHSRDR